MVKMDERSVVPRLDDAALVRLRGALDRPEVVAAWIFGSQAAGRTGPLSDIDIAVWLRQPEDDGLDVRAAATHALATEQVDLVPLDRAPVALRYSALSRRIMIVDRDPDERIRRETRTVLDYFDQEPLRHAEWDGLRQRLAKDTFGRP